MAFTDNSEYISEINLMPTLPTGSGGADESYTLQQLATLFYNRISALEAKVAALENIN